MQEVGSKSKNQIKFKVIKSLQNIVKNKNYWRNSDNLSLSLQKLVPYVIGKGDTAKPKLNEYMPIYFSSTAKDEYKHFFQQYLNMINALNAKYFEVMTKTRVIVGLGDESVYETSIRLHRNYGVPYIPGSALKGITKHWVILQLTEKLCTTKYKGKEYDFLKIAKKIQEMLEKISIEDVPKEIQDLNLKIGNIKITFKDIREIFGTQRQEGNIIFFDAYPNPENLNSRILEMDIMNPHYAPYYLEGNDPGDWYEPTPIFFLTIPRNVKFIIVLGKRERNALVNEAKFLLINALKDLGVGAKTSSGYGYFDEI